MRRQLRRFCAAVTALMFGMSLNVANAAGWKLLSEQTITGFDHPSSVACDIWRDFIYVTDFGPELDPNAGNNNGAIIKLSDRGRIIDRAFLSQPSEPFHRPRGLNLYGPKLWMADLNAVWIFDVTTGEGKKQILPGINFADHVTVDYASHLYVSDSRSDRVIYWQTSDFLSPLRTQVLGPIVTAYEGGGIHPSGLAPGRRGGLFMFGFKSKTEPMGIYFMPYSNDEQYEPTRLKPAEPFSEKIGMIDGVRWLNDNEMLLTDWTTGSLLLWTKGAGVQKLAGGFGGPADLCANLHPMKKREMRVVVPDILKGVVRIMWFSIGDTVLSR